MITLLVSNAVQAALLGAKDSMTPLKALSASALLNAVGDIALGGGNPMREVVSVGGDDVPVWPLAYLCARSDDAAATAALLARGERPRLKGMRRAGERSGYQLLRAPSLVKSA